MATNEEIVAAAQQLYVSYYGRPADPEGLAFWIAEFTESDNVDQVLVDFGTSDEYLAILEDAGTNEAVVNQLYQFMFNRDADEEGLAFYTEILDADPDALASIALDIANGATGDDVTILENKIGVANSFTADVEESGSLYQESDIAGAQGVLALVDASDESVAAGEAASTAFVGALPQEVAGGEYTLDEDNATASYEAATAAVTVILDGDSDEADFDVTLSAFDDTVILEELKSANIVDTQGGVDTLDTSEHNGTATVNLLAGTFSIADGTDTFAGTVSGVENVVGTDNDDTITGDNGDNWITGGDGNDTLKGGIGDDYFVFEDESQIGTGTADGQTGTDTAVFSADDVNLAAVADGHLSVENLVLSNADGEDEVSLTLAVAGSANISTDDFTKIIGSDAVDTVAIAGDINVALVTLEGVEVLAAAANDATVTVNAGTSGLALVGNALGAAATDYGTLALAGGGTFDLSSLVVSGFRSYTGAGNGTTVFETLVVNQAAVDSALGNAISGTVLQENDLFVGLNNAVATVGTDTVQLSGSVDFTGLRFDDNLDFVNLDFGAGNTVLFNDLGATSIGSITGTSDDDTLVVTPGSTAQDYTGRTVTDVETLLIDVTVGNEGVNVTIDEDTLTGVETITGEIDLLVSTSTATEVVDLAGIVVTEGIDLSSQTGSELVSVTQSVIDGFTTLGANAPLAMVMGGDLSIDSSDIKSAITVTGTAGDDSLTVDGTTVGAGTLTNEEGAGGFSIVLGAGNDTLNGGAAGVIVGDVDMGSGNNTVIGVVNGDIDLGDNSAKVLGANDGTNTVIGIATGSITGGSGNDTVSVGGALGGGALGKGDDSFSGLHLAGLTLGAGDDTYTSIGQYQIANAGVAAALPAAVVEGGDGDDTFNINISASTVNGGTGNDVFTINALAFGATIQDLNVGQKDTLQLDLVGTVQTSVAKTTMTDMSGTTTMTSTTTITSTMTMVTTTTTTSTWSAGSLTLSTTRTFVAPSGSMATSTTTTMTGTWVQMTSQMTGQSTTTTFTSTSMSTTGSTTATMTLTNTVFSTGFGFVSATSGTTTSALAAALTEAGGLKVLNQQGDLVTIAPGEAIGTSALATFTSSGSFLSGFLTNTTATMGIGTSASGGVRQSLANTTYVAFGFSGTALVAILVTASSGATNTVTSGEITTVNIAGITANGGLTAADIILI